MLCPASVPLLKKDTGSFRVLWVFSARLTTKSDLRRGGEDPGPQSHSRSVSVGPAPRSPLPVDSYLPTCRFRGLSKDWNGLPDGRSVGRRWGHPCILQSVMDGKSVTTSLVNRKLSLEALSDFAGI